ncbi:hypothetical protein ACJX0J_015131, partial [Zea mays]
HRGWELYQRKGRRLCMYLFLAWLNVFYKDPHIAFLEKQSSLLLRGKTLGISKIPRLLMIELKSLACPDPDLELRGGNLFALKKVQKCDKSLLRAAKLPARKGSDESVNIRMKQKNV